MDLPKRNNLNEYQRTCLAFLPTAKKPKGPSTSILVERGLSRGRLHLIDADATPPAPAPRTDNDKVLTDVRVDGAIRSALGESSGAVSAG